MVDFKIYLSGIPGLEDDWRVPINPKQDFKVNIENKLEKVDVFGLGEVVLKRNLGLQTFGWESYIPANPDEVRVMSGIDNYYEEPIEVINAIKEAANEVINLLIIIEDDNGKETPFLDMDVMIQNFTTINRGGIKGDIDYSIQFTEYQEPKIVPIQLPQPAPTLPLNTPPYIPIQNNNSKENVNDTNDNGIGDSVIVNGKAYKFSLFFGSDSKIFVLDDFRFTDDGVIYSPLSNVSGKVIQVVDDATIGTKNGDKCSFYQVEFDSPIKSSNPIDVIGAKILTLFKGTANGTVEIKTKKNAYFRKDDCKKVR